MTFDPDALAHGARLKLQRANRHIEELNAATAAFTESGAARLVLKSDAKARERAVVFEEDESPEDLFGPIIGDAAHNLRTALDLLAVSAAKAAGATSLDGIYFPFHKRPEGFEGAITGTQIHRCGPDVRDIILKLQLHEGSDSPMRKLHDLDIRDKHLVIVAASTVASFDAAARIIPIDPSFPSGIGLNRFGSLKSGSKLIVWPYNPPNRQERRATGYVERDYKLDAALNVIFGNVPGFEFEPVVPTLKRLLDFTDRVVTSIAVATARFLASRG